MELKKTIVILYGKEKHELIAHGIKAHLASFSNNYDTISIDDESFCPNYNAIIKRKFYKFSQRNANWLYSVYSKINEKKSLKAFNRQRKNVSLGENSVRKTEKIRQKTSYVKNIMLRFNPFAVVCLTPNALKLALVAREMYKYDAKIVAFMPDFGIDLRFLDVRCDMYFVANEFVKKKILKYGIGEEKIIITGVPYVDKMKENLDKIECRREFNIDNDLPLIVLSGGRYGSFKIIDDYNKILDSICSFNLIALSGGNKKLSALMKAKKPKDTTKKVQIFEKADMKKLLTAADYFVTVPTTENVLQGLIYNNAVITTNPLAMVEKSNYNYFKNSKIAKAAKNAHFSALFITDLILEEKDKNKLLNKANEYINNINDEETRNIFMLMEGKNSE